jgi:hypothetical protein
MTVFEDIPLFLKLRLKDKLPPVTLRFIPSDKKDQMEIFYSTIIKEPLEGQHNGHSIRVSNSPVYLVISLKKLSYQGRQREENQSFLKSGCI